MPGRSISTRAVSCAPLGIVLLAGLVGCASSGGSSTSGDTEGVNNGLAHMQGGTAGREAGSTDAQAGLSDTEIADQLARSMDALEGYFGDQSIGNDGRSPVVADQTEANASPAEGPDGDEVSAGDVAPETVMPDPEPAVAEPGARARTLALELEAVLRETAEDPYALAFRLAGLLAGEPDAAERLRAVVSRLPEDQRGVIQAVTAVLAEADGDVQSITDVLITNAELLDEARPVRIGNMSLCSRVEGFGRYTELPSTGFVAGSPMKMIIYTEVDHFDRTPIERTPGSASQGGLSIDKGWEVRLSQELQLYHEADGLLAWRRPEQVTSYRSRSKQHDYFIVDQIQLPRTLTVGAYRLKVVLTDLADRSVDERTIPIRVVADPALTGRVSTIFGG